MATSTERINDLIQAGNDWKAQADALLADRLAHQQAYEALSGNLKNVVANEMFFVATVDPDEAAPTNERGGTYTTLKAAIEDAPRGAFVRLSLLPGKAYPVTETINAGNRQVMFQLDGNGANPVVQTECTVFGGENAIRAFAHDAGASYIFRNVDLQLPTALADAGLVLSARTAVFEYSVGVPAVASFFNSTISGGIVGHDTGIMTCHGSAQSHLGLYTSTLDGPFYGVNHADRGIALIQTQSVTLLNGAALQNGGTLGTDLLQS